MGTGLIRRRFTFEIGFGFVVAAVLLRLALDFTYLNVISSVFEYQGFLPNFFLFPYIESWIAFLILLVVTPKRFRRPSDFFVTYLVILTALPFIVLYPAMRAPSWALWYLVATVFSIAVFRFRTPFALPQIRNGRTVFTVCALLIISIVTFLLIESGGLRHFNLDFARVYDVRNDVDTLGGSSLVNYLSVWMTKVFGPIMMAIFLLNRRLTLAVMVVLLHVLWFGISQHKSVLFYPALIFLTYRYLRKGISLSFLPMTLLAVIAVSFMLFQFRGDIITISLLVRRALFTPALLTFDYYEFFSQNQFVYWSNSILRSFIPYGYDTSVSTLISMYRGGEGGANNHFLAGGYMQAGAFGLFLYASAIIIVLNIFDSFRRRGLPEWFVVSVGTVPMHALFTSADLPVAIMTHGLGICIVSLIFVGGSYRQNRETT